jgi:hypothetical protein
MPARVSSRVAGSGTSMPTATLRPVTDLGLIPTLGVNGVAPRKTPMPTGPAGTAWKYSSWLSRLSDGSREVRKI